MGEAAQPDDRLRSRLPRIAAASALMGAALWAASAFLAAPLEHSGQRYWALALLVLGGLAFYVVASLATGAFRPSDLRAGFARQR
jgi:putative peptidoglycan lipid II flippase